MILINPPASQAKDKTYATEFLQKNILKTLQPTAINAVEIAKQACEQDKLLEKFSP